MPSAESFRTARWVRTANLLLQALLVSTLFIGGLSYLARLHAWRPDLIANRRYALSPETQSYLRQLTQPVRIVVTFDEHAVDNAGTRQRRTRCEQPAERGICCCHQGQ